MKKVKTNCVFPTDSIMYKSFGKIDYQDCFCISLNNPCNYSIDYLTGLFFTSVPEWVHKLLTLRNFIVSFCGLKGGNIDPTEKPTPSVRYDKGSKIALFPIYDRTDTEIVLAEKDKHLNFRTSVMIEKDSNTTAINLYSSTIVHYNNIWGKLYFLPVRPFHQIIIKTMLKILIRSTDLS